MADIRILEPIITWPKNLIFGAVSGLMHGITNGAPWGMKLGAVAGIAAGILGAAAPIPFVTELIGTGAFGAVNGLVVGALGGTGVGMASGAAIGTVGGAAYGVMNSGAERPHIENKRFGHKAERHMHRNKADEPLDEQTLHYLDDLFDNDPDFVAGLEEEREALLEQEHGR